MNLKFRKNIKSQNNIALVLLALLLTSFSIGFAYLEERLSINGVTAISTIKFDVQFENLSVDTGSTSALTPATISNDKKKITFTVKLEQDNDYYQFETDVVNYGTVDAMMKDAGISGLPDTLKEFIECRLTYTNNTEIKDYDSLRVGGSERIKAIIQFKEGANLNDLPVEERFELVLEIPYVQATDEAVDRNPPVVPRTLLDLMLENDSTIIDTEVDFYNYNESLVNGLYLRDGTENKSYPIYYYRGDVVNNNVIFANFCWQIVRTTETGGIKLVYNGIPTDKNVCDNSLGENNIGLSMYNNMRGSSIYMGYTYNESGIERDSTIKVLIDEWYENYIENNSKNYHYEKYLEDTVWCSDRSVSSTSSSQTFYGARGRIITVKQPSLECSNQSDSYTLKESKNAYNASLKGNGLLDYPIALLTADECNFSGLIVATQSNITSYLAHNLPGNGNWTMSPSYFNSYNNDNFSYMVTWHSNINFALFNSILTSSVGVRPSISLKSGVMVITNGTGEPGTVTNPYIVE